MEGAHYCNLEVMGSSHVTIRKRVLFILFSFLSHNSTWVHRNDGFLVKSERRTLH